MIATACGSIFNLPPANTASAAHSTSGLLSNATSARDVAKLNAQRIVCCSPQPEVTAELPVAEAPVPAVAEIPVEVPAAAPGSVPRPGPTAEAAEAWVVREVEEAQA
jgi:hypothetical protein